MRVIFDTNICIDHLRGFRPATEYLFRCQDMERWISAITVMELYAAPHITAEQQEKMVRLFDGLNGIAATALHLDAVLATRNKKHFDFIPGIIVDCPY